MWSTDLSEYWASYCLSYSKYSFLWLLMQRKWCSCFSAWVPTNQEHAGTAYLQTVVMLRQNQFWRWYQLPSEYLPVLAQLQFLYTFQLLSRAKAGIYWQWPHHSTVPIHLQRQSFICLEKDDNFMEKIKSCRENNIYSPWGHSKFANITLLLAFSAPVVIDFTICIFFLYILCHFSWIYIYTSVRYQQAWNLPMY